uniref:Uncharacterized protein n=1 Tax=Phaeomonas parva TaxID=124430 RepID=A0A7S1XX61_9STRA|mmetsp:Transcript_41306/g.129389  ORF Transcript_41306/g.129389 Transcript_41306/m.129389 type:complete len:821 (+) Transcript_41306:1919-4381(+)
MPGSPHPPRRPRRPRQPRQPRQPCAPPHHPTQSPQPPQPPRRIRRTVSQDTPWNKAEDSYLCCLLPRGVIAALIAVSPDEFCRVFNSLAVDTPDIFWDATTRKRLRADIEALVQRHFRASRSRSGVDMLVHDGNGHAALVHRESFSSFTGIKFMSSVDEFTRRAEENLPRLAAFPSPKHVTRKGLCLAPVDTRPRFLALYIVPFLLARRDDNFIVPPDAVLLRDLLDVVAGEETPSQDTWNRDGADDGAGVLNVDAAERLRVALAASRHLYAYWPASRACWSPAAAKMVMNVVRASLTRDRGNLAAAAAGLAFFLTVSRCERSSRQQAPSSLLDEATLGTCFYVIEIASTRLEAFARGLRGGRGGRGGGDDGDEIWIKDHQIPALSAAFLAMECVRSLCLRTPQVMLDGWAEAFKAQRQRHVRALLALLQVPLRDIYPTLTVAVLDMIVALAAQPSMRNDLVYGGTPVVLLGLILQFLRDEARPLSPKQQQPAPKGEALSTAGALLLSKSWVSSSTAKLLMTPAERENSGGSLGGGDLEDGEEEEEESSDEEDDGMESDEGDDAVSGAAVNGSKDAALGRPGKPEIKLSSRILPTREEWQRQVSARSQRGLLMRIFEALKSLVGSAVPLPPGTKTPRALSFEEIESGMRQLLTPGLLFYLRVAKPSNFLGMISTTESLRLPRVYWTPAMCEKLTLVLRDQERRAQARLRDGQWPAWEIGSFLGADGFKYIYDMAADEIVVDDIFLEVLGNATEAECAQIFAQLIEVEGLEPSSFSESLLISIRSLEAVRQRMAVRTRAEPTRAPFQALHIIISIPLTQTI